MKTRDEVRPIMQEIMAPNSPVGMDPVYVHALILDKLTDIQRRLEALEAKEQQRSAGDRQPAGRG